MFLLNAQPSRRLSTEEGRTSFPRAALNVMKGKGERRFLPRPDTSSYGLEARRYLIVGALRY